MLQLLASHEQALETEYGLEIVSDRRKRFTHRYTTSEESDSAQSFEEHNRKKRYSKYASTLSTEATLIKLHEIEHTLLSLQPENENRIIYNELNTIRPEISKNIPSIDEELLPIEPNKNDISLKTVKILPFIPNIEDVKRRKRFVHRHRYTTSEESDSAQSSEEQNNKKHYRKYQTTLPTEATLITLETTEHRLLSLQPNTENSNELNKIRPNNKQLLQLIPTVNHLLLPSQPLLPLIPYIRDVPTPSVLPVIPNTKDVRRPSLLHLRPNEVSTTSQPQLQLIPTSDNADQIDFDVRSNFNGST